MKTEIFYTETQEDLARQLTGLLTKHIYPGLSPTLYPISARSEGQYLYELVGRYTKLLQASIPPERGLKLSARILEMFGYRVYLQVQYTLGYPVSFSESEAHYFFPAVAMHDRLLMVPDKLGEILRTKAEVLSPFKPLEMGSVMEVDFEDEAGLEKAVLQVWQGLRGDFLREVRAYATYHSGQELDLAQLAQAQDVDVGFIQHVLKSDLEELAFYSLLTCELDQTTISMGRWTKVNLTISNDSREDLANLAVEIGGPVKVRPARIWTSVTAGSAQQLPIALMPEDKGEFPLEIVLTLPEDRAFENWLPVHHVWLQCE